MDELSNTPKRRRRRPKQQEQIQLPPAYYEQLEDPNPPPDLPLEHVVVVELNHPMSVPANSLCPAPVADLSDDLLSVAALAPRVSPTKSQQELFDIFDPFTRSPQKILLNLPY